MAAGAKREKLESPIDKPFQIHETRLWKLETLPGIFFAHGDSTAFCADAATHMVWRPAARIRAIGGGFTPEAIS